MIPLLIPPLACWRATMTRMTKKHELAEKISGLVLSVLDDGPIERSRSFLPLTSGVKVNPGETTMIRARPQLPFRGDRLAVWSVVAPHFFIEGIRVGTRYAGACSGTVPADAFATRLDLLPMLDQQLGRDGFVEVRISKKAQECFGQPLTLPLCPVGQEIIVTVTNSSTDPLLFVAVILGDEEPITAVLPYRSL